MNICFKSVFRTLLILSVLTGILSCAKPISYTSQEELYADELVPVSFSPLEGLHKSKVTGVSESNEIAITRWAVFAFEGSTLVSYDVATSSAPIEMRLRAEHDYTIYAVVNYPTSGTGAFEPASVSSVTDITGKVAYLSDNAYNRLLMFGSTTVTPDPVDPLSPTPPENVTINVQRLVSRVDAVSVAVDFSLKPYLASKTFTLRSLYLTNLYRTARYGSDYASSELSATRSAWYNTGGWHRAESADTAIDALVGSISINTVVDGSHPYNVRNSFYANPNALVIGDDVHQIGSWTKRCTRLIIEADMDGDVMYYMINLPGMVRNHLYSVNSITIKGLGSKDPEVIDNWEDSSDISFSISTSDWDDDYPVTEES